MAVQITQYHAMREELADHLVYKGDATLYKQR